MAGELLFKGRDFRIGRREQRTATSNESRVGPGRALARSDGCWDSGPLQACCSAALGRALLFSRQRQANIQFCSVCVMS